MRVRLIGAGAKRIIRGMGSGRRRETWWRAAGWTLAAALVACAGPALGAPAQVEPGPTGARAASADSPQEAPTAPRAADYVPKTRREMVLAQLFGDHHVAVVGGHVITRAEVFGTLENNEYDPTEGQADLSDQEIFERKFSAALEQIIDQQLKTQGGRLMGFDQELVRGLVDAQFQRWIDRQGGPQRATERLSSFGFTPAGFKEFLKERTLARTWEETMDGRGLGSSGRKDVDNYVRPGELAAYYRNYIASGDPEVQKVVGLSRGSISLQQLLVAVPAPGEGEATRERMVAYRDNLESGVLDFDALVQTTADPNARGEDSYTRDLLPGVVARELARIHPNQATEIEEFLDDPEPGDLSPVCPIERNGLVEGYALYRIVSWEDPSPPLPFVSLELQKALEKAIKEQEAEVRVDRALARLARTTHISPDWIRQALIGRGQRNPAARTEGRTPRREAGPTTQ